MKVIHKTTTSSNQTQKLGEFWARQIKNKHSQAIVLALQGDLGGGKTTFLQGFAKGLGIKDKITSPTFVILKRFKNFYHLDCYRLEKAKEILDLGFKKIIKNPKNIVAIEWADRIKKLLPKDAIIIKFDFINKNTRKIKIIWKPIQKN